MSEGAVYVANNPTAIIASLPAGLATEAKQDTSNTKLDTVNSNLDSIEAKLITIDEQQDIGNTSLSDIAANTATTNELVGPDDYTPSARWVPNKIHKVGFAAAVSNGIDTSLMTELCVGAGMTRNQTGGNLVVTTGTTANEEFLARSNFSVKGAFNFIFSETQSTRTSANNDIGFWLADNIGEGLSFTVNSATSITVSAVPGTWTSGNVGQFMNISCGNLAGFVPGRYAIASVSGSNLTFTVSGFPGSGSGTCSLWGWNHYKMVATNTTTTNMAFTAQRKGWAVADTQATISTITSGHMSGLFSDGIIASFSDSAQGSQTGAMSARASRQQGVPDQDVELYVYLQARNTTTPVAITWTMDFFAVEDVPNNKVIIGQTNRHAFNFFTPSGTVNVAGPNAHDSSTLMNPVVAGARGSNALTTAVAHNDTATLISDLRSRLLVYGNNPREIADKNIATVTNTTETTLIAAVASILHDITLLVLSNDGATGVRVDIRDSTGGTVRLSPYVAAGATVVIPMGTQPMPQTTANNNWTIQASGSTTSLRVTAMSVRS